MEQLTARVRQGRIVGLLGERDLSGTDVPVSFFGEPVCMPPGPARLAIDTGAPLLPMRCWFTTDGWGFHVDAPIATVGGVQATTQALADRFAAHPADRRMLQPVWTADRRVHGDARSGSSRFCCTPVAYTEA